MKYFHAFMKLNDEFEEVQVEHIDRNYNEREDELTKIVSDKRPTQLRTLIHETLLEPSIHSDECMNISSDSKEWMVDIMDYLAKGNLPGNALKAKVL